MKKLVSAILVSSLFLTSLTGSVVSAAEREIKVTVDGALVNFDVKPYVDENYRTLVPISFIAQKLGAEVKWFEVSQTVQINKENTQILLTIDSKMVNVNGENKEMDTVAKTKDGRTMVPVAFISQYLGANVNYVKETDTVNIITKNYVAPAMNEIEYSKYFNKDEIAKDSTLQDKPLFETNEIQGINTRLFNALDNSTKNKADTVILDYNDIGLGYSFSYIILTDGSKIDTTGTRNTSATFRRENLIGKTIDKVVMFSNKGKKINIVMDITDIEIKTKERSN